MDYNTDADEQHFNIVHIQVGLILTTLGCVRRLILKNILDFTICSGFVCKILFFKVNSNYSCVE